MNYFYLDSREINCVNYKRTIADLEYNMNVSNSNVKIKLSDVRSSANLYLYKRTFLSGLENR